jgi:hypothetical protein
MKVKYTVLAGVVAASCCMPLASHAATIVLKANFPATLNPAPNTTLLASGAGKFMGNITSFTVNGSPQTPPSFFSPSNVGGTDTEFYAWCIQYNENVSIGSTVYTYNMVDPSLAPVTQPGFQMGTQGASDLAKLFGTLNPVLDGTISTSFDGSIAGIDAQNRLNAFQLALWEIAYESSSAYGIGTLGLGNGDNGSFDLDALAAVGRVCSGAECSQDIALANYWLGQLSSWTQSANNLWALTNGSYQDYIIRTTDNFVPTPLPPAVWLFGSALLGTAAIARRRKKTA